MAIDKAVDSSVLDGYFDDIADAIRAKNGNASTYTPAQMPAAIAAIPTGPAKSSSDLTVSGATVTAPAGLYAQDASKSVATATQATPSVSIDGDGLVTATATQTAGYVSAGSKSGTLQLTKRTSSDLSASGATVTAPAGYYPSAASTAVSSATHAAPSISVSSGGLITATHVQSAGYGSADTKSATQQLTVQAGTTITPGATEQVAVAAGKYTTGDVKVAAVVQNTGVVTHFTLSSNIATTGWYTAIASTSPLAAQIAAHRDDPSLAVMYYKTTASSAAGLGFVAAKQGLIGSSAANQGTQYRTNTSGGAAVTAMSNVDLKEGTNGVSGGVGRVKINSDGSVELYVYSSYPLLAGEYVLAVMW